MAEFVGQPSTVQMADVAFSDVSYNDLLFSGVCWDELELRLFPGLAKSESAETPAPAASVPVAHPAPAPAPAPTPRPSLSRMQVPAAPVQGPYAPGPIPQHQYIPVPAGYLVPQLQHIPTPFDPARRFVTMLHYFRPKHPLSYIADLVLQHFNVSMTPADVASIHAAIPFSWLSGYAERLRSDGLQALSKAELQEIGPWLKEHAMDKYKQLMPYLGVRSEETAPAREKKEPMLKLRGEKGRKKRELIKEMRGAKRQLEEVEAEEEMERASTRSKRPKSEEEVPASEPHAQADQSSSPQLEPLHPEVRPPHPSASGKRRKVKSPQACRKPRAAKAASPRASKKSTKPTSSSDTGPASPCALDISPIPASTSQFCKANPADPETVEKFIRLLLHGMPDIALKRLHSLVGTELGVWMTATELKESKARARAGASKWLMDLWTRSNQRGWSFLDPADRGIVKIWLRRHRVHGELARDLRAEMEKHEITSEAGDNTPQSHHSSASASAATTPPSSTLPSTSSSPPSRASGTPSTPRSRTRGSKFSSDSPADPATVGKFIALITQLRPDMEPDDLRLIAGQELGVLLTSAELEAIKSKVKIRATEASKWLQGMTARLQDGGGLAGLEIGERELVQGWLERHARSCWNFVKGLTTRYGLEGAARVPGTRGLGHPASAEAWKATV